MFLNLYVRVLVATLILLFPISGLAQWQELNPGAGGQVQDIVPSPSVDGRLFLVSDMEGIYRSEDNGQTWQYTSDDLTHHRTFTVAVDPNVPSRVYAGTINGVHVSSNGGVNWSLAKSTEGFSVGMIAVNPSDTQHIIAGQGWRDDYNYGGGIGSHNIDSKPTIFQSFDGGQSWNEMRLPGDANANGNILSIAFLPNDENRAYLASAQGLYRTDNKGASWSRISTPVIPGLTLYACTGVAVSPNGEQMYVSYQTGSNVTNSPAILFATPTADIKWSRLSNREGLEEIFLWQPQVSPLSSATTHKILLPTLKDRSGLWEGTVRWKDGVFDGVTFEKIWSGTAGYDPGWENTSPGPRVARYTPADWSEEAIWSTINQSMHRGLRQANGSFEWQNRYSIKVSDFSFRAWNADQFTYASRGTASTYTFDVAVDKNYVIQGQADNGFMESWDYGKSWTNIPGRVLFVYDARAVAIASVAQSKAVLAQGAKAFGGNANEGRLYLKRLKTYSPEDEWELIGGGEENKGGIPNELIQEIAVDPKNQGNVFVGFDTAGLYWIKNLNSFANGNSRAIKISAGRFDSVREVAFHPDNNNIVYVAAYGANRGLYKGTYDPSNGQWSWQLMISARGANAQVKSWKHNEQHFLLYAGQFFEDDRPANMPADQQAVALSLDGGATWESVFTPSDAKRLRTNLWFEDIEYSYDFNVAGVAAYGNNIIFSYYDHSWSKGYGTFKAKINEDAAFNGLAMEWQDWTSNFHFKGGTDAEVFTVGSEKFYYTGTQGVGLWRRALYENDELNTAPEPDVNDFEERFAASPISLYGYYSLQSHSSNLVASAVRESAFERVALEGAQTEIFQHWAFEKVFDNNYRIRNRSTDLYLSPYSKEEWVAVNSVPFNENWDSLIWRVDRVANDVKIFNTWSNKYLSIPETLSQGLSQSSLQGNDAGQRWALQETDQRVEVVDLAGIRSIENVAHESLAGAQSMNDFDGVSLFDTQELVFASHQWAFEHLDGNTYRIKNLSTGNYLNPFSNEQGVIVNLAPLNNSWASLKWRVDKIAQNRYRIRNTWSGKYLTVLNESGALGMVGLRTAWDEQVWKLDE